MKGWLVLAFLTTIVIVFATLSTRSSLAQKPDVTFTRDVAPIFYKHCAACHQPDDIAPFSVLEYKDVLPWKETIRQKVSAREMPPWHADGSVGHFANERRLSERDIQTLTMSEKALNNSFVAMFSAVLTAYSMFFRNENLLEVNLLVYVLPLVSMTVALVFVHKNVGFEAVPGFDRLSGLMILIACSFGLALAIHKTRIFVGFFGSIDRLFLLAAGIFALLKWSGYMLFRRKDEPARERPSLPLK